MTDLRPPNTETPATPFANSPLGRTLGGRYQILDVLGSGGMATVFRANDLQLRRRVAVKVLYPQLAADEDLVQRFRHEAQLAAGLSAHPNIVSIYDLGEDAGFRYIVMECVQGRALSETIVDAAPLCVDRAFAVGRQIAAALTFAHSRGVVHRDIKPHNILVAADGQVKVADFGIARAVDATRMTRSGVVLGTVSYLSPEQAQGKPATYSSDIYALGVVLFEMLAGRVPFEGDNAVAIALQHVHEEPPSPRRFNSAVSDADAAVVLKALNKRPADRFSNAAEFGSALQRKKIPPVGTTTVYGPLPHDRIERTVSVPLSRSRTRLVTVLVLPGVFALAGWFVLDRTGDTSNRAAPSPTLTLAPTRIPVAVQPQPTPTRIPVAAQSQPTATAAQSQPTATAAQSQPTATLAPSPTTVPAPATQVPAITKHVIPPPGQRSDLGNGQGRGKARERDHGQGRGKGHGKKGG